MSVGFDLPEQFAVRSVDGVHVAFQVSEIERAATRASGCGAQGGSVAHIILGFEGPILASAGGVQGIDSVCIAANKNTSRGDRWLADYGFRIGNTEGPFELQPGHLGGGYCSVFRRLKSRVLDVGAPTIPGGLAARIAQGRVVRTLLR